jgi:hypothetical protein
VEATQRRAATIACLAAAALLTACSTTSGIRKLSDVETKYFADLKGQLQSSTPKLQNLLEKRTAVNEETALREVALLDDNIRRAKLVYSVREVLTAPATDSAEFIQVTRNKVILYHLAEAGQARNEKLVAEMAKGREERKQLISDLGALNKLVAEAIASNEILHNHLNKPGTAQLADLIAEVGRQVTAFNEGIKAADQNNPAIQQMVDAGKTADRRVQQADEGLSKFIEVWSKLNEEKK